MDTKLILKERARLMAEEEAREDFDQKFLEIVEFHIEKERYSIEIAFVSKVQSIEYLTPIPGLPNFMPGIINIHGEIIPILDIKKFFDLKETGDGFFKKGIILRYQQTVLGILADEVLGVIKLPENELQTSLPTLTGIRSDYLKGISRSQIVVLDPEKLCLDKRIVVHQAS